MPLFRVHYDYTTREGIITESRDIEAKTPIAAAQETMRIKSPYVIFVRKTKRLVERAASHGEKQALLRASARQRPASGRHKKTEAA